MQTLFLKKVSILFILILGFLQPVRSQTDIQKLSSADSLFKEKKLAEAYHLYYDLWQNHRWYSPQMLLKMAYIKESSNDYAGALYYINLYQLQNPDKNVSQKIKNLADKNHYTGYDYNDFDYLLTLFHQYDVYVIILLMSAAFIIFVTIIRKRRSKELVLYHPIIFMLFLGAAYLLINYSDTYQKGIIGNNMVYLMGGPSAGAELRQVVDKGHMVTIKGKDDVWYQIDWRGEDAYIHQKNLLVVEK
jgi:hypothetical protein